MYFQYKVDFHCYVSFCGWLASTCKSNIDTQNSADIFKRRYIFQRFQTIMFGIHIEFQIFQGCIHGYMGAFIANDVSWSLDVLELRFGGRITWSGANAEAIMKIWKGKRVYTEYIHIFYTSRSGVRGPYCPNWSRRENLVVSSFKMPLGPFGLSLS